MWWVQAAARRLCCLETFCRRNLALCTYEELHEVMMMLMCTQFPPIQADQCFGSHDEHTTCCTDATCLFLWLFAIEYDACCWQL